MKRNDDWVTKLKLKTKDFYWEEGKVVMTERYHLKRGSCCGSGCRHCPYFPTHKKMNKEVREDLPKIH